MRVGMVCAHEVRLGVPGHLLDRNRLDRSLGTGAAECARSGITPVMMFNPQIEGAVPIRSAAPQFLEALRQRVRAGFLTGQPHPRSNYRMSETQSGQVVVHAADWRTATNVGLNELELQTPQRGSVRYRVRYWRWVWFGLALSGVLGFIGLVLLLS